MDDRGHGEVGRGHGAIELRRGAGTVQTRGKFAKLRDTDPIAVDVYLAPSDSTECPPEPSYLLMLPLMVTVADKDNFSVVDLDRCTASIKISQAAMAHPLYVRCFLLVCRRAKRGSSPRSRKPGPPR